MTIISPLDDDARQAASEALQRALADLILLGLLAKQAHWNLVGPSFLTLHRQLDELADAAREQSDVIAERVVTIGGVPDGRAATVASSDRLPAVSSGPFNDRDVVKIFCDILAAVVATLRGAISVTADADPVSQDALIGAAAVFEKHYWMFQAELA